MHDRVRVLDFAPSVFASRASRSSEFPFEPALASAWRTRISRCPHANFTMSLDYLAHRAARGEASRGVLVDAADRRAAFVLREEAGGCLCGLPWRWQLVFEGADPKRPEGMTADDAEWAFEHAQRLAGDRRLRFFAPCMEADLRAYLAGRTVLIGVAHAPEERLFAAMDPSRRRLARRGERQGHVVVEADTFDQRRDFEAMLVENVERREGRSHADALGAAELESAARAWEHPWHWLLVGTKDGAVVAGLGSGRCPGGMVDLRASGSTPDARRVGVNSQVWWEAVRRARLAGHSWVNLGGATPYKREFGGEVVSVHGRLGGDVRWVVPNTLEVLRRRGEQLALAGRALARRSRPVRQERNGPAGAGRSR